MVSARHGFQKLYDLPERVLPEWVDTRAPDMDEFAAHLIDSSLRAHGFTTLTSITYLRKGQKLRAAVRRQLDARTESENLICVDPGNGTQIYIDPELLDRRAPHTSAQPRILSPFDNVVIQRQRGRDVFDFDYQIECYLPEPKRVHGYFCLPILYRDRLAGRVDCKAHRSSRRLEIKALHIENRVDEAFSERFGQALASFAAFNGCDQIFAAKGVSNRYLNECSIYSL
jgi:uncharacterized protein YcaQ